ncbi:TPA: XRE family transcriptional regulator [Streptococcus suis]|nr:XRE family transcriptional regulator [Streptococcus suis]
MARGRGAATPQDLEYMKILSENLQLLLKQGAFKQADIVRATGIPASTLTGYVKGNSLPVAANVEKLADFFQVDPAQIDPRFSKVIAMPKSSSTPVLEAIQETVVQLLPARQEFILTSAKEQLEEQKQELFEASLVEYHIYEKLSAGTGTATYDDLNYDIAYFDQDLDHDIASWIFGDSMEPKYLNGQVALIKETGFDYDGAVYAVVWDGQTYIKKVYREEDGLRLVSLNSKYSDKFAPYDEDPRIVGKIVGSFTPVER